MQLEFIKTAACPDCGCSHVVAESVDVRENALTGLREVHQHCHGGTWEKREFLCGAIVSWIPNYDGERIYINCKHSPAAKKAAARKRELRTAIENLNRELQALA